MAAHSRRLAQRVDQLAVDVVHLDRREAQAREPGNRADLAHEARQLVPGVAVAVAAEVDPGEDDLAMSLFDPPVRLREHRAGGAAARGTAHERDHAEVAGEAAAVLDLDERSNAIEACVCLHAAERSDGTGDERRRLLTP